jgi:hypothetical protein
MAAVERQIHKIHSSEHREESIHPLKAMLWEALLAADTEKEYVPDRARQQVVFDRLNWETFSDELGKEIGGKGEGAGKRMRGKLFEMLINADPTFGERTPLELELLSLAHNPNAYNLGKELGYHRNPDMAFLIVEKSDGVVIEGIGESKLGLLNERSFHQLSETGFARGIRALVDVVNNLPDPEAHGLVEVARARSELGSDMPLLSVSPEFTQLVVVPANRKPEWSSTLINRREFTVDKRNEFRELLNDTERVLVRRAAFSTAEVGALAHALGDSSRPVRSEPARYQK